MFEMLLSGRKAQSGGVGMFVREVPASEFITGAALAAAIGLTAGTAMADAGWLHYEDTVDGKTKYISKRSLRHTVSWDQLHAKGAVFGTRTVVVEGKTYKVRLLKGLVANALVGTTYGFDIPTTHGCEWNRLMYHISAKPFTHPSNTLASEGISEGDWASYSEADLGATTGNGKYQWCQETGTTGITRVWRGAVGVSYLYQIAASYVDAGFGWRAVLELVD